MALEAGKQVSRDSGEIPVVLSTRSKRWRVLLERWRKDNARVPWARLVDDGLALALEPYAGKREKHLVANGKAA